MSCRFGMAYSYQIVVPATIDLTTGGSQFQLLVRRRSDNVVETWTVAGGLVIDDATHAHYDAAAEELAAGHYSLLYDWRPAGPSDDPQYPADGPQHFEVKALWAA